MNRIVNFEDFVNRGVKTEEQVSSEQKANEELEARKVFLESKKDEVVALVQEMLEAGMIEEGLFGAKSTEDMLKKATPEFLSSLAEAEKLAEEKGDKIVFSKDKVVKAAYDNKFRGTIQKIPYQGKVHIQYKDGLSALNKLAAGTGSMTVGESVTEEKPTEE